MQNILQQKWSETEKVIQEKLLKSILEWIPEFWLHINDDGDKPKQGIYELLYFLNLYVT